MISLLIEQIFKPSDIFKFKDINGKIVEKAAVKSGNHIKFHTIHPITKENWLQAHSNTIPINNSYSNRLKNSIIDIPAFSNNSKYAY